MRNLRVAALPILPGVGLIIALGMILSTLYFHVRSTEASPSPFVTLNGSTAQWTKAAHFIRVHSPYDKLTIGLLLKAQDPGAQQRLLHDLYNPHSNHYHKWITPADFAARFGPASAQRSATIHFLTQEGLKLIPSSNPALILARGTVQQIEGIFHTTINDYSFGAAQSYYGNNADLKLPKLIAGNVLGVFGLNGFAAFKAYDIRDNEASKKKPQPYGGGPLGSGLTPSQFTSIYHIDPVYQSLKARGQGTTLGLFELSGYKANDISQYEKQYKLPAAPLVDRLVMGGATDHKNAGEVELDIELQLATAPGIKQLIVYQSPNTELGSLAQFQRMADDNQADALSISWGSSCEYSVTSQLALAEYQIFLQMALQGQSLFSASGDSGAYGCAGSDSKPPASQSLQIGDPNNQPYVTSVGGTSFRQLDGNILFDPHNDPHPQYPGASKELAWISHPCNATTCAGGGSGGGVSRVWGSGDYVFDSHNHPLPGVIETRAKGYDADYSQYGAYCHQEAGVLCRQNPDVAIDADPGTGFSIYCTDPGDSSCSTGEFTSQPGWVRIGGTSCAAPIWAGIAALARTYYDQRPGLFNYIIYHFDNAAGFSHQFHDITGLNNGYYPAGPNYDMATGLGSPDAFELIKAIQSPN
ncbi:S53 family peptidase [Ktedonosporobacter rubrisoli]|uniref:S53 family peptidase n=1 Tax=Ktedonosporobacter rubrisoli TaxID=2509675 RepID=UPI0013EE5C0E|nr:S53 family peptidase [Ktedonosporobacter rubrisoli]